MIWRLLFVTLLCSPCGDTKDLTLRRVGRFGLKNLIDTERFFVNIIHRHREVMREKIGNRDGE
jgi:hypothetical protein